VPADFPHRPLHADPDVGYRSQQSARSGRRAHTKALFAKASWQTPAPISITSCSGTANEIDIVDPGEHHQTTRCESLLHAIDDVEAAAIAIVSGSLSSMSRASIRLWGCRAKKSGIALRDR